MARVAPHPVLTKANQVKAGSEHNNSLPHLKFTLMLGSDLEVILWLFKVLKVL